MEFLPVILFVAVYFNTRDIYLSTGVLIAGVAAQVVFEKIRFKQISQQTRVIFWISLVFGGATLLLRNELFIQWKPTIVNWFFAGVLIGNHLVGREDLFKRMLGHQLPLPVEVWNKLSLGWALGIFVAGLLNLFVAYNFSLEFWVAYKLIGGIAIPLTYLIITIIYLAGSGYLKDLPRENGKPEDLQTEND